jgi:hypothetical protein
MNVLNESENERRTSNLPMAQWQFQHVIMTPVLIRQQQKFPWKYNMTGFTQIARWGLADADRYPDDMVMVTGDFLACFAICRSIAGSVFILPATYRNYTLLW